MTAKHVKGCGNYDSASGICRLMHTGGKLPSLAKDEMIDPPGAIEGPPTVVKGWVCTASGNPGKQESCTAYVSRLSTQDEDDLNI